MSSEKQNETKLEPSDTQDALLKALEAIKVLQDKIESLEKETKSKHKIGDAVKNSEKKRSERVIKEVVKTVKRSRKPKAVDELVESQKAPEFSLPTDTKKVGFRGNLFQDDGKLCAVDKEFNKKYGKKYQISPRVRPPVEIIDVKCEYCPARGKINKAAARSDYWVCPQCVRKSSYR